MDNVLIVVEDLRIGGVEDLPQAVDDAARRADVLLKRGNVVRPGGLVATPGLATQLEVGA
ncbi:hypothetical protein [Baekduia alba]|uniref:hypothetical protein n=1 Tax=Baekduia alba TaxID=2997333 RepID=UPI00233FD748|nr:hypothetical protein [Baekduia alba]